MKVPLPDGYSWRPIDPSLDLRSVSDLLAACDLHDIGSKDLEDALITESWNNPNHRGGVLVDDGAGLVIGLGELEAVDATVFVDLFAAVHPDHRAAGVRSALVGWGEEHAVDLAVGGPTTLLVTGSAEDASFGTELEGLGYRHVRTFWHMQRTLPASDQPSDDPPGVRVRRSVVGDDDHAVYDVMREAFEGHFGYVDVPLEAWWHEQRSSDLYDPGLFLLAEVDGRVVGAVSCFLMEEVGWIGELGVLRSFRGRGLGKALLRRAFAELGQRGAPRARLNVDSENEAGATRLYRAVGMAVLRSFLVYEKRVGEG